jgi:tetratricopeptide (TPR) repeat protein
MTRKRILVATAAAVVVAAAGSLGGVLSGSTGSSPAPALEPGDTPARILAGFSPTSNTATYVRELEAKVRQNPTDGATLSLLGLGYEQRARETGDPTFYPLAGAALRRAMRAQGDHYLAQTGLASLAASRHRFRDARRLAEAAIRSSPTSAMAYGVVGDALVELGRYGEAFSAFDRMVSIKPGIASYARVSYARELLGRPDAAVAAMNLAVETGSANAENHAWTLVQLGNLEFDNGRFDSAAGAYQLALRRLPGYVYAEAGLARVDAARGRYDAAVRLYRSAVDTIPLPQFAVGLGDTLAVAGRPREAGKAYALVDVIQRLFAANGVRTELETARFDLDHGRNVAAALVRAKQAYRDRKSIEAEDTLAWGYYKNGRCREALVHSRRALRLGTRDALKLFDRGMIERCLGHEEAGRAFLRRALGINPRFSLLYAPVARKVLR